MSEMLRTVNHDSPSLTEAMKTKGANRDRPLILSARHIPTSYTAPNDDSMMSDQIDNSFTPFRPTAADLARIETDVAEIGSFQRRLVANCPALRRNDRVAHQQQIAGGKVMVRVASRLPGVLEGLGLFQPGGQYCGIGRISTGLGIPHIETNPDFLGAMTAFQTPTGQRVDFLAINDPTAPTDNHPDFVSVLHATAESAGAEVPFIGDWGDYEAGNLIAEQAQFGLALAKRIGLRRAGKIVGHIVRQTLRTFNSSSAYQSYWTGIVEARGTAGKFTLVPTRDENRSPGFRPGQFHLSEEWRERQRTGDIEFSLYWIPYLDDHQTSVRTLTQPWQETHKQLVGTVIFPRIDPDSEEAQLWATLATEMGANPGNWIADNLNVVTEPATEFGVARKIAYRMSQAGRGALDPETYATVFTSGEIGPGLANELTRRRLAREAP
jgi:hypothetical protein